MKTYEKVSIFSLSAVFLSMLLYCTIITIRYNNSIQSLEQYRLELEQSRERNRQYAETYRQARATNTELGNCIYRQSKTLSELREQLQAVRKIYDEMENRLCIIGCDNPDSSSTALSE